MEQVTLTQGQLKFIENRIELLAVKQILPVMKDIAVNAYLYGMSDATGKITDLECDVIFWEEKAEETHRVVASFLIEMGKHDVSEPVAKLLGELNLWLRKASRGIDK